MPRPKKILPLPLDELKPLPKDFLNLEEIIVDGEISETGTLIVVQAHTCHANPPVCQKCGLNAAVIKADIRYGNFHDVEQDGKLVRIVLGRQRHHCSTCNKTFTPPLSFQEKGRVQRTTRLEEKVVGLSDERSTTTDLAVRTGLSRRTVQAIGFKAASLKPSPQEVFSAVAAAHGAGCILQIDDAHPSNGPNTAILLNGKRFELLDEYNEKAVEAFFYSLSHRECIKCYVSDMAAFLICLGKRYFPFALIVADPFHVIRRILLRFDAMIRPYQNKIRDEFRLAIMKGSIPYKPRSKRSKSKKTLAKPKETPPQPKWGEIKALLHANIMNLNADETKSIKYLMKRFPAMRAGYAYLQRVLRLYRTAFTPAAASKAFDRFEKRLPAETSKKFGPFLRLCRKRRNEICAYWACGWTTGKSEAQNGVIKRIDQRGGHLGHPELRRSWLYGRSASEVLGRYASEVSSRKAKKNITAKDISELRSLPVPEAVPLVSQDGQLSLFGDPE